MGTRTCTARRSGDRLVLEAPGYTFTLGVAGPLTAVSWKNHHTGDDLPLGGAPECEIDLDVADDRIWIEGWRHRTSKGLPAEPEADEGLAEGRHTGDFRDTDWDTIDMPTDIRVHEHTGFTWARTSVFLPRRHEGKPLALVLGGRDLFDYAYMRVFLNGHELATRRISARWNEPLAIDLGPETAAASHILWNGMNTVALQLSGQIHRTARLDAVDPTGSAEVPGAQVLASTFDQYFVVGQNTRTPELLVQDVHVEGSGSEECTVTVSLAAAEGDVSADVVYRLSDREACLKRDVTILNTSGSDQRLMHVRSGPYAAGADVSEGGRGYPAYVGTDRFVALAHPAGWVTGSDDGILVRQFPGVLLRPGEEWHSMQAVFGMAPAGEARKLFLGYVEARSRRVVRGHDRPYAVYEPFGSWSIAEDRELWVKESEEMLMRNLARVKEGQEQDGCMFDIYSVDFWVDYHGDVIRANPDRFPNGLAPVLEELQRMGITPGLWIDSSGAGWSIGGNTAMAGCYCFNHSYPVFPFFCRATDPVKTLFVEGFRHHIRENGVRLVKFDNLRSYCNNVRHDHLPGIYSTETIQNAVIDMLHGLDEESPDVFIMLYWGHRSPWWLLHGDTLFEPGLAIEAASPGAAPTLYARDGVTQGLDRAQQWCADTPPIGKDSLGVWLSDWFWNSGIGAERWQEGFVMDMCRGSLLAQPWSDDPWLNSPERRQLATFMALLRERPECFRRPRLILGDPWKEEPYGYVCSDAERAFVAIFNCSWEDFEVDLALDGRWGLPDGRSWQVFRWYPDPARLRNDKQDLRIAMRPFDVVLLEVAPEGAAPSLGRAFETIEPVRRFSEPSREIPLTSIECGEDAHMPLPVESGEEAEKKTAGLVKRTFTLSGHVPATSAGGTLVPAVEMFSGSKRYRRGNPGSLFAAKASVGGGSADARPVLAEEGYPAGWQAWRIAAPPGCEDRAFEVTFTVMLPEEVELRTGCWFVPL